MRIVLAFAVVAVLSGCGLAQKALFPPQAPRAVINDDEFSKQAEIVGHQVYDNPLMGPFRAWMLRSFVDRGSGEVTHQLYVETHYDYLWPLFDAASDDETTDLRVSRIDKHLALCTSHHREDCFYFETDAVALDDAFLRRRASNGFRVKLYGHSGETTIVDVTPQMIGLQLEAVDKAKGGSASGGRP